MDTLLLVSDTALCVMAIHRVWRLELRQRAVEERLWALSRLAGVMGKADSAPSARVEALALQQGRDVEAIRAYRVETGSSLRQAKARIDAIKGGAASP